jgi:hypothetical protein
MDDNPRHFFIDAVGIDANVDADEQSDFVTIEFAGSVTPTVKKRLIKALEANRFEIAIKKLS